MRANKALKRLAKIEASMSDVMERYSASAPHLREVLKDFKAAVARVKEAVNVQVPSRTTKKRVAAAKAGRAEKKAAPTLKAVPKKVSVKASTAKSVKKRAPIKKTAKKAAGEKMDPAPAQAATNAATQEPVPAPIGL